MLEKLENILFYFIRVPNHVFFRSEKTEKSKKAEKEFDEEKAPLLKSDPMEYQREMEKKKRIHKAREALSTSMKQKKKEEEEEQAR